MAGAPLGNTNSATGKEGRRALEFALEDWGSDKPKKLIGRMATLVKMWKPIIDKAMAEGDLAAMKEINDRLDGRPAQSIEHSGQVITKERDLTKAETEAINESLGKDY